MSTAVDLVVIGAGISGLGVARAAREEKLDVLVFERGEIARATSDNSLRIIHGGFRYLQNLNISRVIESLRAQSELLHAYPDIIQLFPCVMPLSRVGLKSGPFARLGLSIYSALASLKGIDVRPGRVMSSREVGENVPALNGVAPHGALLWFDAALLDHHGLTDRLVGEIGVERIYSREPILSVTREGEFLVVRTEQKTLRAHAVVNTAGPWIKGLRPYMPEIPDRRGHHWAKAFNVVVRHQVDPLYGVGIRSKEGRLFFAVPRSGGQTAIGTGYTLHEGLPDSATVSEGEISTFLAEFSRALPTRRVTLQDLTQVEVGILPLRNPAPTALVGSSVVTSERGYFEVISTKYTTFLPQGRRVIQQVKQWLDDRSV